MHHTSWICLFLIWSLQWVVASLFLIYLWIARENWFWYCLWSPLKWDKFNDFQKKLGLKPTKNDIHISKTSLGLKPIKNWFTNFATLGPRPIKLSQINIFPKIVGTKPIKIGPDWILPKYWAWSPFKLVQVKFSKILGRSPLKWTQFNDLRKNWTWGLLKIGPD